MTTRRRGDTATESPSQREAQCWGPLVIPTAVLMLRVRYGRKFPNNDHGFDALCSGVGVVSTWRGRQSHLDPSRTHLYPSLEWPGISIRGQSDDLWVVDP